MSHKINAQALARPRVIDAIAEAIDSTTFVLLTGPAGYGKSTVARALMQNPKWHIHSAAVPPGTKVINYLWDSVFGQFAEQGSELSRHIQNVGYPADAGVFRHIASSLKKEVSSRPKPSLVIVDDYQFAESPDLDTFIEYLIRQEIPDFCLLLISRTRPNLPMEEFKLKGLAKIFNKNHLAFTREESRKLFELYGVPDKKAADAAWKFSEGWAAALWLSLNSYKSGGLVQPIHDMDRFINETIFLRYSLEDQKLLLQLSVLDSFSPHMVKLLTNDPSAPHKLRALYEKNAFINYDAVNNKYTMHSIFRVYLNSRLEENILPAAMEIDRAALSRRLGECHVEYGDYLSAIRAFEQAGDHEALLRILHLFENYGTSLFIRLDPAGVRAIMSRIPAEVCCRCPLGYLGFIYSYMVQINKKEGEAMLEAAIRMFEQPDAIPASFRSRLQGEIEVLRAMAAPMRDIGIVCEHYAKASNYLQGPSRLMLQQGAWYFLYPSMQVTLYKPGELKKNIKLVEKNKDHFETLASHMAKGIVDLMQAEYYFDTGKIELFRQYLQRSIHKAREDAPLVNKASHAYFTTRLLIANGHADLGWEHISQFHQQEVLTKGNFWEIRNNEVVLAQIASVLNRPDDIPSWIFNKEEACVQYGVQPPNQLLDIRGEALLAAQKWDELALLTEEAKKHVSKDQVYYVAHRVRLLVILAIVAGQQNMTQATNYLKSAVELCRPDRYIMPIAEFGAHLLPLMLQLRKKSLSDEYLEDLLKFTRKYAKDCVNESILLTVKEQRVYEQARKGVSNTLIAEQLGIKPASVSNMLHRINKKLGIKGKTGPRKRKRTGAVTA